jgi:hypothetical protein
MIGSLYDYFYDAKCQCWKSWNHIFAFGYGGDARTLSWSADILKTRSHISLSLDSELLFVPTEETTRYKMFANYLNEISHPILMFGGSSSGKTMVAYVILNNLASMKDYQVVEITFHCNSTKGSLHDVLKPRLIIQKRRILTPISHKKLAIFVDDMNMSSQTTIQCLRCLIE